MRKLIFVTSGLSLALLAASPVSASNKDAKAYKWVDKDGVVQYSDMVPPDAADAHKDALNEHGVVIGRIEGKKTAEELAAEQLELKAEAERQARRKADLALLGTYLSVDEIEDHRDRRIELFTAQSRVTELYLRNMQRKLKKLEQEASHYSPYSPDPDAPMIDQELVVVIQETEATIERHEGNLRKYEQDVDQIRERFAIDIERFKELKGEASLADSTGS